MITTSNSLSQGSGRSNQVSGDSLHTMDVVGLSGVRTEFHSLLIIPLRAPHPVERDRYLPCHRYLGNPFGDIQRRVNCLTKIFNSSQRSMVTCNGAGN